MQMQGTISNIVSEGGYQSQNGYINTFQMSIMTPAGLYTGQIGAKTAVYPAGVGDPIIVEVSQSTKGMKFKKINPKFAGQPQAPQPQPQYAPPLPQGAVNLPMPAQQQGHKPDWDKIAEGKVRTLVVCSYLNGGKEPDYSKIPAHVRYCMTGIAPGSTVGMSNQELLSQPPEFDDQREPGDDDIAF